MRILCMFFFFFLLASCSTSMPGRWFESESEKLIIEAIEDYGQKDAQAGYQTYSKS